MTSPLGSLSVEQFLADYWQKKPLVIRQGLADFEPIISPDEMAGLALEQDVESRLIIQSEDGENFQLEQGPFEESRFAELPASHWTLLIQALDHWLPEAKMLLDQFRFIPGWRVDDLMASFATQGGGVGPHYDNYDVFLIQASGRRRWEFGGLYGEHSPRKPDVPVMILPDWQAEQSVILEPGDILYLPPRVGHNGVALDDNCATYSVGFRAPSHTEILQQFTDFVGERLSSDLRYQDSDLATQVHPGEITDAAFTKVRNILQSYLDKPALLETWFGCYMTEHKYPELQQQWVWEQPVDDILEELAEGGEVQPASGSRFAYQLDNQQGLRLFVNGRCCDLEQDLLPVVQALCDNQILEVDGSSDDVMMLFAQLLSAGAIELL